MNDVFARLLAAERAAEQELTAVPDWLWDGRTPPVPVDALADSHYGLLVEEHQELGSVSGMGPEAYVSGVLLPHAREIWVNAGEAPQRRRFTIGHELGHWVLHSRLGGAAEEQVVHCRASEVREEAGEPATHAPEEAERYLAYPPLELDANQFAAALLMPAAAVRAGRQSVGDDVERLSVLFGVSAEAIRRRLWWLARVRDSLPT